MAEIFLITFDGNISFKYVHNLNFFLHINVFLFNKEDREMFLLIFLNKFLLLSCKKISIYQKKRVLSNVIEHSREWIKLIISVNKVNS